MSRTLTNKFLMVIAVIGILVTTVLTIQHFKPGAGGLCQAGRNSCEGVLKSQYGSVAGIPTAILGLGMYLTFLYLGVERGKLLKKQAVLEGQRAQAYAEGEGEADEPATTGVRPGIQKLDQYLWLMAASAFGISWWLQYTALFVLTAFCPWCFSSALLVTLLFILTSYDFHFAGGQATGEKKMLAGISSVIVVMLGMMYYPVIAMQYQIVKRGVKEVTGPEKVAKENAAELVAKTRWWRGEKTATVSMVEFADYMCATCKAADGYIKDYMKMRSQGVRLGFMNFPVPIPSHKWSRLAAQTAEAAGKQGKFWEMHDYLFEHQDDMKLPTFTAEQFEVFAKEVGLDMETFRKDMKDAKTAEIVVSDEQLAAKNAVNATPTSFLFNGEIAWKCEGTEPLQAIMMDMKHPIWKNSTQK